MGKVLLLVTWLVQDQPPSNYQATFDSMEACLQAQAEVIADGDRMKQGVIDHNNWLAKNSTAYNPGIPPEVSAVCAAQ